MSGIQISNVSELPQEVLDICSANNPDSRFKAGLIREPFKQRGQLGGINTFSGFKQWPSGGVVLFVEKSGDALSVTSLDDLKRFYLKLDGSGIGEDDFKIQSVRPGPANQDLTIITINAAI